MNQRSAMQLLGLIPVFLLTLLPFNMQAQVRAEARVNSTSALVGDRIQLQLEVSSPESIRPGEPQFRGLDTLESLELLQSSDWDSLTEDGSRRYRKDFVFTAWDSGYFYLPRVEVPYQISNQDAQQLVITPNAIPLNIGTVPVDTAQLAPIKPIMTTPGPGLQWQHLALLLGALLLLIGLVIAWRRWVNRAGPKIPELEIDTRAPHEIAFDKLLELEASNLLETGEEKEFQSQLTHILREYLEGRFGIHALEQTTDQILRQLDRIGLDPERVSVLRNLLPMADLVKFAKARPPQKFHTQALQDVRSWIDYTIPKSEEIQEEE